MRRSIEEWCEAGTCFHDLAQGVLTKDELLDRNGPHPDDLSLIFRNLPAAAEAIPGIETDDEGLT